MSNAAKRTANLFMACRDEKRKNAGGRDPRELGIYKSVPARKKIRRESK